MISDAHRSDILRSWALVEPIAETAADLFYKRLFEIAPQYRPLFTKNMESQKRKLIAMLRFIVKAVDWPPSAWTESVDVDQDLFLVVLALGRRHTALYRVPDEAYADVGAALLWTLDYGLGEAFTTPVREAWTRIYGLVSQTMKMGRCSVGSGSALQGVADG